MVGRQFCQRSGSPPVLEATSTLVAATGILNVWINDPAATATADAALRAEHPGRFLLGIGIGHPEATSDYRRPLATMRSFLDGLDTSPTPPPAEQRCLAALGPKMLDLARERAAGTHSYFVPVEHTRFARERLGPGRLVAPDSRASSTPIRCAPERSPAGTRSCTSACATTRGTCSSFGFTEGDVAGGGSDRLIDAVIPHGTAEQIAEVVPAHLDAGADHVCLQPLGEAGIPRESWAALAKVLID